jgi:hypothetical protein
MERDVERIVRLHDLGRCIQREGRAQACARIGDSVFAESAKATLSNVTFSARKPAVVLFATLLAMVSRRRCNASWPESAT